MPLAKKGIDLHVFGFQNFHNHPGHRKDLPINVKLYDAFANEAPKSAGFGVTLAKEYVTRICPDVIVIFNDLLVLTSILNEVKDAPNRKDFKIITYIDQVYLSQRKEFVEFVNTHADAAMTFTPQWNECIVGQGLKIPTYTLPHGINTKTYFPIPKHLARRFFGVPEDAFLILNLNRNQPRKRWDICMQAFAEVVRRLPEAPIKLVIGTGMVGAWNLKDLFERELQKRGVPLELGMSRLIVPGHPQMLTDEETNFLYNIADIGINTCDGEGFGLCNFEQAAIGIPQIVTKLGGFLHFFDEDTAVMVPPKLSIYVDSTRDGVGGEAEIASPNDFADAIIKYYNDKGLMERHGKTARARIIDLFSWEKVSETFCDILEKVCPTMPSQNKIEYPPFHSTDSINNQTIQTNQTNVSKMECITSILKTGCDIFPKDDMEVKNKKNNNEEGSGISVDEIEELRVLKKRIEEIMDKCSEGRHKRK